MSGVVINDSKMGQLKGTSFLKALLIYISVSLFLFFEMAVQVSPSVMAQDLIQDLNISALSLGVMSSVYFYTYTFMQIPSGLLFDRFNPGKIIFLAILVCSVGAFTFGYAINFYLACAARLLMGFGSAFAFVSVLVMAARLFKSKWFSMLAGITQMLAAFGAMAGQMPISFLVQSLGWHHTMYFLSAVGILLAFASLFLIGDHGQPNHETISTHERKSFQNIKASLSIILSKSQTWFIAIYACLLWAPMSGFASLWGVPFLESVDGLSKNEAAFYCSLMWLGLAIGSPLFGFISTVIKNKVLSLTLSAALGVIAFSFILLTTLHGFLLGFALFMSGAACAGQALSFSLVKDNNTKMVSGTAIAFNNMAVVISGAIFQPLIGWLLHSSTFNTASQFITALSVILLTYLLGFLIALIFISYRKKENKATKKNKKIDEGTMSGFCPYQAVLTGDK